VTGKGRASRRRASSSPSPRSQAMPAALTYPGVYVEEVPSGVRTIVGVPTSVTAFLGRAPRGPTTGDAVAVFSFDEFERRFGGLDLAYPLTFAVRDYFLNGGAQAVVARLLAAPTGGAAAAAVATAPALPGVASSSEGAWGSRLWVQELAVVDSPDARDRFGV